MGIRRDSQGRSEHPARRPETEKRVGTLRLRDRQEHQTHSETLLWQGFPQYGSNGPDRERLRGTECGQCHLRREQEQTGEDRGHQFRGKRSLLGQKTAAHTEKDASGQPQHLPEFQAQRDRLRRGQGESARLLQFAGIPQCRHRAGFDVRYQRQTHRHRHTDRGRRQILHPQRIVGRQQPILDRTAASHAGYRKGRYLRQKDAPQTAWHRP